MFAVTKPRFFLFGAEFPDYIVYKLIRILRVAWETFAEEVRMGQVSKHWFDGIHDWLRQTVFNCAVFAFLGSFYLKTLF